MSKPTYSVENPEYGSTVVLEKKDGKRSVKYIYPDAPKSYTPTDTKFPSVSSVVASQNARKMVAEMKEEKERDKRLNENLRKVREKEEQREKEAQRLKEEEQRKKEMDEITFSSSDDDIATILKKNREQENKRKQSSKKGGKRKKTKKQSKKGRAQSRRR